MGFARLAAPTGFGGADIAPPSAGNALQAGTGRRLKPTRAGLAPWRQFGRG